MYSVGMDAIITAQELIKNLPSNAPFSVLRKDGETVTFLSAEPNPCEVMAQLFPWVGKTSQHGDVNIGQNAKFYCPWADKDLY